MMDNNIAAETAKLAGLQIDFLQKIRNNKITLEEFEKFLNLSPADRQKALGISNEKSDGKFTFLKEFQITVPDDYQCEKHLKKFAKANKKKFYGYNDDLTDRQEYANPSHQLIPGKTYTVKIWGINQGQVVTSEECLRLLKDNKVFLTGAQGLSLAWEQKKEEFIKGKWLVSFDEKEKLWQDANGYHRVPNFYLISDGGWGFVLGRFERGWDGGDCLFGLCD